MRYTVLTIFLLQQAMQNDKKLKPNYYSVIPAEVRYCKALGNASPRDIYGEITALCNKLGYCFASNQYFAELYEVDARTIRRWISLLEKQGFIFIKIKGKLRKLFLAQKIKFDMAGLEEPDEEAPEEHHEMPAVQEKTKTKKQIKPAIKNDKFKYIDKDLYLAEMLLSKIIYNFPSFENKKVNIKEWADEMRKLREIDKATEAQIEFMIVWLHGGTITPANKNMPPRNFEPHEFWSKNIMSAGKLRKQWFDHLVPQLQASVKKQIKKNTSVQL